MNIYDKNGSPISMEEWGERLKAPEYKRVAETTLTDGKWISTVWLGLDHGFEGGQPLIFETMVFTSEKDLDEHDMERYCNIEQAEQGHIDMVKKWEV